VKEGSEVVVALSKKGTEETAEEIDRVGKDGLKVTEGTVSKIDAEAKLWWSRRQLELRKLSA